MSVSDSATLLHASIWKQTMHVQTIEIFRTTPCTCACIVHGRYYMRAHAVFMHSNLIQKSNLLMWCMVILLGLSIPLAVLTYLRSSSVSAILRATDDPSYALRDMQTTRVTVSSPPVYHEHFA